MTFIPRPTKVFGQASGQTSEDLRVEQSNQVKQISEEVKRFAAVADRYEQENDEDFYAIVVFRSNEQRKSFLKAFNMEDDELVNGVKIASACGITLPPGPDLKDHNPRRKWARFVR